MSKASLKKILKTMSAEEIAAVVLEMYEARKEAKEYLDYWENPDPARALEEYRKLVQNYYFTPSEIARKNPTLSELIRLRRNFSTLVFDTEKDIELLLFICEKEYEWIIAREGKSNTRIPKLVDRVEEAAGEIEIAGMENLFGVRLGKIRDRVRHLSNNPPVRTYRRRRRWW